jgi:hypothetical protein
MKNTPHSKHLGASTNSQTSTTGQAQIHRPAHTASYGVQRRKASRADVVEARELPLSYHRVEYVRALVERRTMRPAFPFAVFSRVNVFHEQLLGSVARQLQVREEFREQIQHRVREGA